MLDRRDAARRELGAKETDSAAIKRAEAQIAGILTERLWHRLRATSARESTDAVLRSVAAHEVDPYTAADELLSHIQAVRP